MSAKKNTPGSAATENRRSYYDSTESIIQKDGAGGKDEKAQSWPESLKPEHVAQLQASGISPAVAREARLCSGDEHAIQNVLGRGASVGTGLVIPYHDPATGGPLHINIRGQRVPFIRVRLDNPERARDKQGKPSKYLSRRGSGQHPFILPRVAKATQQGAEQVILVEGEKKALSAVSHGFNAIGLSGNWGWKVKDKQALLPLLNQHIRPGMTVVIVWDSDAALNAGFAAATRMLADILRRNGCRVKVIVLPQEGTAKVGLDDFIVAHGVDAFRALVAQTTFLPTDRQVAAGELMQAWAAALTPALENLDEDGTREVLRTSFRKGLIDRVDHDTRGRVLAELEGATDGNVTTIFQAAVEHYLHNEWPNTDLSAPNPALIPGCTSELPDGKQVRVADLQGGVAWVTGTRHRDKSWPVPASELTLVRGPGHGGQFVAADVADDIVRQRFKTDGELALRSWRGLFYAYDRATNSYREIADTDIDALVMQHLRDTDRGNARPGRRREVVENLKAIAHVESEVEPPCMIGDGPPQPIEHVIVFCNGYLCVQALRDGRDDAEIFRPPTPRLFTTNGRHYHFDAAAECPRWIGHLERVLPDTELRGLVQELFGYVQIACTQLERFFVLDGEGANGKSVVLDVLMAVLGQGNVCSIPLARFGERFAIYPLMTCLANIVNETPATQYGSGTSKIAEDKVKAIVSGNPVEFERKNRDIVTARATARLVFASNELPRITDRSQGLWRRLIILPFEHVIPESERDPYFARKIIADELPGIMNWSLEGLLRLLDRGRFVEPEACLRPKAKHRQECAPEEEFLAEHVTQAGPDSFVSGQELYAAYRIYMASAGHQYVLTERRFRKAVERLFKVNVDANGNRIDNRGVDADGNRSRGYYCIEFHPNGNGDDGGKSDE